VLVACRKATQVRFGKHGTARLRPGYYAYTGSALGRGAVSLEGRLARHRRFDKAKRWHIDYLTSHPAFRLVAAVYVLSDERLECTVNGSICRNFQVQPVLPQLGSTDCNCQAHLLRFARQLTKSQVTKKLIRLYSEFGQPCVYELRLAGPLPSASGKHP
jgi:Uri superfamily endonuclease